jgi:hypothetical protein
MVNNKILISNNNDHDKEDNIYVPLSPNDLKLIFSILEYVIEKK